MPSNGSEVTVVLHRKIDIGPKPIESFRFYILRYQDGWTIHFQTQWLSVREYMRDIAKHGINDIVQYPVIQDFNPHPRVGAELANFIRDNLIPKEWRSTWGRAEGMHKEVSVITAPRVDIARR